MSIEKRRKDRYFILANLILLLLGTLILTIGFLSSDVPDWQNVLINVGSNIIVISLIFFIGQLLLFDNRVDVEEKLDSIEHFLRGEKQLFLTRAQAIANQPFEEFIKQANDVLIGGVALRSICREYTQTLREKLDKGCKLRFIVLNPQSPDVSTIAASWNVSTKYIEGDIVATLKTIEQLKAYSLSIRKGSVEVRLFNREPVYSFTLCGAKRNAGALRAELRVFGIDLGDRPVWELKPKDTPWFTNFVRMCEALWENAVPNG